MAQKINIPINPNLKDKREKLNRVQALTNGDERIFENSEFCLKLPGETAQSYKYRRGVFAKGFVNPAIELLSAPANTIYRNEVKTEIERDNSRTAMFNDNVTMGQSNEMPLLLWMKEIACTGLRRDGTVFAVMDMPRVEGSQSEKFQKDNRIWPFIELLDPLQVLNYEYKNGELLWFAYTVVDCDAWENPTEKQPKAETQIRIWTRKEYVKVHPNGTTDVFPNTFGFVPVLIQASYKPDPNNILGEAPFFTTSNLIITANNHLSTINIELWKHSSAMMLMHRESIIGENSDTDIHGNMSFKTTADGSTFIWGGTEKPSFLVRDLEVVTPALDMYKQYMGEAVDNERSARSVAKTGYDGTDVAQSGIALIIEKDPIMANIVSTAIDMESLHNRILIMADLMIGNGVRQNDISVEYDTNYNVNTFKQAVEDAVKFKELNVPSDIANKENYKKVAIHVLPDKEMQNKAFDEIDSADLDASITPDITLEKDILNVPDA